MDDLVRDKLLEELEQTLTKLDILYDRKMEIVVQLREGGMAWTKLALLLDTSPSWVKTHVESYQEYKTEIAKLDPWLKED